MNLICFWFCIAKDLLETFEIMCGRWNERHGLRFEARDYLIQSGFLELQTQGMKRLPQRTGYRIQDDTGCTCAPLC